MQTTSPDIISKYVKAGWWGEVTLNSIFASAVKDNPKSLAICDPINRDKMVSGNMLRLSFSELESHVEHVAHCLYVNGLRRNDKIILQMPNVVEIVLVYLAASRLGLIISPVAMEYGHHELKFIGDTIKPKAYIAFREFKNSEFGAVQGAIFDKSCKKLFFGIGGVFENKNEELNDYLKYKESIKVNANDIMTICWTSGTTGRSKGVPRSHNHWLSSTLASEDAIKLKTGAVMLNPFPFINMAAIGGFLFYWLKVRGRLILHHPFDPNVYLSQIQNEKVEYTIAPPAVLTRLLQTKDQIKANFDLSSLRVIGSGSAPLSKEMVQGFENEFDVSIINIFGSNEGMAILSSPSDVLNPELRASFFPRFGRDEFEWDNRISQQIKTKLIDLETGVEIVDPSVPGELLISGATVFDGYYNSPLDNKEAFSSDGYFRSGDLFEISGENNQFYKFVGRCKSLIVRGGVNISPEELDELISSHVHIVEAVVVAYPDRVMGEKICAVLVPHKGRVITLSDICSHLDKKKVAKFKWPEKLLITKVLPRN
ncbi:acyl--CoA ligase, partial [Hellea sp.]|nr:acyl--CoA ligase [Hellea sp.]